LTGGAEAQIIRGDVALAARSSRWISITGLVIGIFFLLYQFFIENRPLFRASLEGATGSFAAMVVAGVAHRFWIGAQVAEAGGGPSGFNVRFLHATSRPLRLLNDEVRAQLDAVNQRLHDIEQDMEAVKRALRRVGVDE
jgi:hypothetical protein